MYERCLMKDDNVVWVSFVEWRCGPRLLMRTQSWPMCCVRVSETVKGWKKSARASDIPTYGQLILIKPWEVYYSACLTAIKCLTKIFTLYHDISLSALNDFICWLVTQFTTPQNLYSRVLIMCSYNYHNLRIYFICFHVVFNNYRVFPW